MEEFMKDLEVDLDPETFLRKCGEDNKDAENQLV